MPLSGHNLGCSLHFPVLRFHAYHQDMMQKKKKKCHLPFISSVSSFNSKQKDPHFNHYFENTYITEPLLSHYNLRAKSTTTVNPIRSSVHDYYWGAGHFWRKKKSHIWQVYNSLQYFPEISQCSFSKLPLFKTLTFLYHFVLRILLSLCCSDKNRVSIRCKLYQLSLQ